MMKSVWMIFLIWKGSKKSTKGARKEHFSFRGTSSCSSRRQEGLRSNSLRLWLRKLKTVQIAPWKVIGRHQAVIHLRAVVARRWVSQILKKKKNRLQSMVMPKSPTCLLAWKTLKNLEWQGQRCWSCLNTLCSQRWSPVSTCESFAATTATACVGSLLSRKHRRHIRFRLLKANLKLGISSCALSEINVKPFNSHLSRINSSR